MMDSNRRVTIKLKNPNPLFEKWLKEWHDEALKKNSKTAKAFKLALDSLKKYPLPLETGRDCIILKGFGRKLCQMLDNKLQEHRNQDNIDEGPNIVKVSSEKVIKINNTKRKSSTHRQVYVPTYRSGAYAILLTLYKKCCVNNYKPHLTKSEIIKYAQPFCDKSFTKPDPGTFYTSWSSMKTLLEKNLIKKEGLPPIFSLSEEGKHLACKLLKLEGDDTQNLNTSECPLIKDQLNPTLLENFESSSQGSSAMISLNKDTFDCKETNEILETQHSSSTVNNYIPIGTQSETDSVSSNSQDSEVFFLLPNSFDIILLVDTNETAGSSQAAYDMTLTELTCLNVLYEVRHLKVGDYTWICRDRVTKRELLLPHIIERKRMDDFGKSVKDGRFHEQKFRLRQTGIQNVTYLVESLGNNEHVGLPISSLYQAATNTLLHDAFDVKFTESLKGTVEYLASKTRLLIRLYQNKTLMSCLKENMSKVDLQDDLIPLITFQEFNKSASKSRNFTVKEMFARHLLQIKGMSVDKALAIVERYPTPKLLKQGYDECSTDKGENLLSQIKYGKIKKNIGPVLSKIVYQLYTSASF